MVKLYRSDNRQLQFMKNSKERKAAQQSCLCKSIAPEQPFTGFCHRQLVTDTAPQYHFPTELTVKHCTTFNFWL